MSTMPPTDFDFMDDWSDDLAEMDQVMSATASAATVRFNLFLKVREIEQLAVVVQNLQSQAPAQRQAWLKANQALAAELVRDFTDESLTQLEGVATDHESVKLSVDLVTNLRQTLISLEGLLFESKKSVTRHS